jgi:quinolinate synthase
MDVKAESDICCASGHAAAVVTSLNTDTVVFLLDEYLAQNVARETGKRIVQPIRYSGRISVSVCPTATGLADPQLSWISRSASRIW